MLFVILVFFALTVGDVSTLKCYKCEDEHVNFWIDAKTLPKFPTNCSFVEAKHQCTTTIRWFTLQNGKESYIDYLGDFNLNFLPKGSSLSFAFVHAHRELETASTRALIYSCTTDTCNNHTTLQQILSSLTLEENFASLDVLFKNNTANFTDQNSCVEFSNSTHLECPSSASPLSSCSSCLLLERKSPQELCARCPKNSPETSVDFVERRVFFFLENRTRLADQITLVCRTKGCNALDNVKKIHQLSKLEFNFKDFLVTASSATSLFALSIPMNLLFFLWHLL